MERFRSFNWNASSEWQEYLKRIDATTAGALDRAKMKWYKANVDANFENDTPSVSQSRPQPSSSSSSSSSSSRSGSQRQSINGLSRENIIMSLHAASLLFGVLYLVGGFLGLFGFFLRLAFLCQVGLWGFLLYLEVGTPQFSAEFAARAFQRDASHYFVFSTLFAAQPDSILPFIPLAIYSLFNASGPLSRRYPPLQPLVSKIQPFSAQAFQVALQVEVLLLPMLIVLFFLGGSSILSIFGVYQFLKFRYMFSQQARVVVDHYVGILDNLMRQTGPVAPFYFKARNWLAMAPQPPQ